MRNVDTVVARLQERAEVHCVLADSQRTQWIYFGVPRCAKYTPGAEGIVCFGDIALNKQSRRLKLRSMTTPRMQIVSTFLGNLLKGLICHPRKKLHPVERIDKRTRRKFFVLPSEEARALGLCENCGASAAKLQLCGRCRTAKYCRCATRCAAVARPLTPPQQGVPGRRLAGAPRVVRCA